MISTISTKSDPIGKVQLLPYHVSQSGYVPITRKGLYFAPSNIGFDVVSIGKGIALRTQLVKRFTRRYRYYEIISLVSA